MFNFTRPLAQELIALQDLYQQTSGSGWRWKTNSFTGIPWDFTGGVGSHPGN